MYNMNGLFNGGLFNQNYVNFMMYNNYQGNTEQFKPIVKKQPAKKYSVISDEQRQTIIRMVVEENKLVREASEVSGVKLSTCKAILKTFKTQGRLGKKEHRAQKRKSQRIPKQKPIDHEKLLKTQLPKVGEQYLLNNWMYQPMPQFTMGNVWQGLVENQIKFEV